MRAFSFKYINSGGRLVKRKSTSRICLSRSTLNESKYFVDQSGYKDISFLLNICNLIRSFKQCNWARIAFHAYFFSMVFLVVSFSSKLKIFGKFRHMKISSIQSALKSGLEHKTRTNMIGWFRVLVSHETRVELLDGMRCWKCFIGNVTGGNVMGRHKSKQKQCATLTCNFAFAAACRGKECAESTGKSWMSFILFYNQYLSVSNGLCSAKANDFRHIFDGCRTSVAYFRSIKLNV